MEEGGGKRRRGRLSVCRRRFLLRRRPRPRPALRLPIDFNRAPI
ncbi:hypothetical protein L249_1456 [Ophiocordyceps polyrhachis-furcata BCC 54312]|uniref:Uncharacterized protein n=1 Tax=Ophiocordyceps polyrhachis-furcata BCC 54312 TaxID=1330021 RepID=A0A367L4D6_9HYPO|nr:hypothetical protein L249_1456 [Ophiocordyceps polyrhachis-furcata BCC 54312]